jgi:hypothetical protein
MATAKARSQLRRLSDLSLIRSELAKALHRPANQNASLIDIAALCAPRARARLGSDCHAVRDEILTIAAEWDLRRDWLEDQSDACIAAIAAILTR